MYKETLLLSGKWISLVSLLGTISGSIYAPAGFSGCSAFSILKKGSTGPPGASEEDRPTISRSSLSS
jgi:hypothetical protein